jgi:hypothetical protein
METTEKETSVTDFYKAEVERMKSKGFTDDEIATRLDALVMLGNLVTWVIR